MPYLSTEHAKRIRDNVKKAFPEFKFSIRKEHHSSIVVSILSGPIELITKDIYTNRYEQVNHYYIKEHYKDFPEIKDMLLKLYKIINEGNYTENVDGDYGAIPSFYVNIEIGKWNKPYEVIK